MSARLSHLLFGADLTWMCGEFMSEGNSGNVFKEARATWLLALPLIIGQVSQMAMGVVDTVMIGELGVVPLGASSFANNLMLIPFIFSIGVLTSISVRVSQSKGADDQQGTSQALRHGTGVGVLVGVVSAVVLTGISPFLHLFGQDPEVAAAAGSYLILIGWSLVPAMLYTVFKNYADALNRPWPVFWISVAGVGLNVLLNWLLIYGKWGCPAMGLDGAGVATLLARVATALGVVLWVLRSKYTREWNPRRWFHRWDSTVVKALMALGIPVGLQLLMEVGLFAGAGLVVGMLGKYPLAAHQVAMTCTSMAFMVPLGVSMALTVRVGEVAGRNELWRLRSVVLGGWGMATVFAVLSMGTLLLFRYEIAESIVADPQVIEIAVQLLLIAGIFQWVDGMQVVSSACLRGLNEVHYPAKVAGFGYWLIAFPLGAFLALFSSAGAQGMWWGMAVGLGLTAFLLGVRLKKMAWEA